MKVRFSLQRQALPGLARVGGLDQPQMGRKVLAQVGVSAAQKGAGAGDGDGERHVVLPPVGDPGGGAVLIDAEHREGPAA